MDMYADNSAFFIEINVILIYNEQNSVRRSTKKHKEGKIMPRISVIVPAYNAQEHLKKCVDSILAQSFADLELIVIDDGSTDETGSICDAYAASDPRVQVIHQENGGVSRARNAGLDAAEGELIAFVDADDHLLPEAYECMLAAMERHGAGTAMCNFIAEAPDGALSPYGAHVPGGFYDAEAAKSLIARPLLCDRLGAGFNGFVWCYLFSAADIKRANIRFTGAYLEDELFLIEYFAQGHELAVEDEELYRYCLNPASVTRRYLKGYTDTFARSFELKRELVKKYSIDVSEDWEQTTLWAGLLIAVANEFAPGNTRPESERVKELRRLCQDGIFAGAVKNHKPEGMGRNKAVVAALIRLRMYRTLAALYRVKNRNRS